MQIMLGIDDYNCLKRWEYLELLHVVIEGVGRVFKGEVISFVSKNSQCFFIAQNIEGTFLLNIFDKLNVAAVLVIPCFSLN